MRNIFADCAAAESTFDFFSRTEMSQESEYSVYPDWSTLVVEVFVCLFFTSSKAYAKTPLRNFFTALA